MQQQKTGVNRWVNRWLNRWVNRWVNLGGNLANRRGTTSAAAPNPR
jgi:hypothetical protein